MLCIPAQAISFMDDDHLKRMLAPIEQLCLGKVLDDFLDNNAIVNAHLGGVQLDMVGTGKDGHFNLAARRGHEYTLINLHLGHRRVEYFGEQGPKASCLASTTRPGQNQMWEIFRMSLLT